MSVQAACDWFGISRQAYYQARRRALSRAAEDGLILALVQGWRARHPRMGTRKLHYELQKPLAAMGISRGRDAFFDLLRQHNLLIAPKRNRRRTTRSGLWRCENLYAGLEVQHINQVWVGDITYLTTAQGFVYLALLTDAFSRFIVGYDVSSSLAAEGSLRALNNGLKRASQLPAGMIHHSDHGVQYAAYPYRERLDKAGIRSSMGEVGNCYENALAERINGILKGEYNLDAFFINLEQAQKTVHEAVWLYNFERPHLALNYYKPAEIYLNN